MKFPSIIRLPQHQKFKFQPRHYDPIKEEIENKKRLAKLKVAGQDKGEYFKTRISETYGNRRSRSSSSSGGVLIIFLILLGSFLSYVYLDNFWLPLLFLPLYIWFRYRAPKIFNKE
ncbi:MAG: hypothetical protein LAT68_04935 [Cyclobacteriaceae bacterium]|nr:hypothetical protein [Cyclobacteriaceae bacterium]MCH8515657.1 hypothetical protein [Cyclobacteriaceae bacterium]